MWAKQINNASKNIQLLWRYGRIYSILYPQLFTVGLCECCPTFDTHSCECQDVEADFNGLCLCKMPVLVIDIAAIEQWISIAAPPITLYWSPTIVQYFRHKRGQTTPGRALKRDNKTNCKKNKCKHPTDGLSGCICLVHPVIPILNWLKKPGHRSVGSLHFFLLRSPSLFFATHLPRDGRWSLSSSRSLDSCHRSGPHSPLHHLGLLTGLWQLDILLWNDLGPRVSGSRNAAKTLKPQREHHTSFPPHPLP